MDDAIGGALAGLTARCLTAPLDVLKIRRQLYHQSTQLSLWSQTKYLWQSEGVKVFWQGNSPALLLYSSYGMIQFSIYGYLSEKLSSSWSGAGSSFIATGVTYPLDVLRTRMAAQRLNENQTRLSLLQTSRILYQQQGFRSFYRGLIPTWIQTVPYMSLVFYFNEKCLHFIKAVDWLKVDKVSQSTAAGVISGSLAKWICMPLDNVRKRMQVIGNESLSSQAYKGRGGWWHCAVWMVQKEGWTTLWRGSVPALLKAGPVSAITFGTLTFYKTFIHRY